MSRSASLTSSSVALNDSINVCGSFRKNPTVSVRSTRCLLGKMKLRVVGSSVAENRLFATLDPTTRSFILPNKQRVLLTDTVGFLRKLPHTLIESFKATLEEVSEADLLIHIVDLSHPRVDDQMEAVEGVIKELDAL